ncbi:MAG: hypothetical protein ABIK85_01865, partial [Candidatus Eisenbacteria bacterium]
LPFMPVLAASDADSVTRSTTCVFLTLMVLVFMLFASGPAVADLTLVRLIPEEPTESDTVRILVRGLFLDDCWSVPVSECGTAIGDTMAVNIYAIDSYGTTWCSPAFVPYGFECDYGRLPVGHYVIPVNEHRDSVRYPPLQWVDVEFDVEPSTPLESATWGRIRALYR